MTTIKQLPKAVHSSLRSSVILFDLTRVVEELIFNSIDSGATKVNISISVGTCYTKVEDDGCGMTRDGLVLIGERYVTSKLHCMAEMDVATESFGFRGEALGSLSDVSLVEITTKARGRPNGYRKIIKGCKCLYLGIDDNRRESGTTVIVRDLFYNQPVRRKYMQSSPKKVLHSVKKCVLRIALVRPQVSFRVTDTDSGDEVLRTCPSMSPLRLVTTNFGNDVSRSLCELNFSNGVLKLSGYLSSAVGTLPMKARVAFQYVYVNSRLVCKGPIHKLLNNLTAGSNCLDLWKDASGSQNGKRSRTQAYPAYILNLCCPRSCYDLTFEPSKTIVEFKDWVPVLSFIEKAIGHFWRQMPDQGESFGHEDEVSRKDEIWKKDDDIVSPIQDISMDSEIMKKKCRIQHNLSCLHLNPSSCSLEITSEESDFSPHWKNYSESSGELSRRTTEVNGQQTNTGVHQSDYTFQDMTSTTWDAFSFECVPTVSPERDDHLWPPDNGPFSVEDNLLSSTLTVRHTFEDNVDKNILGLGWGNEFLEADANVKERSTRSLLTCDRVDYRNKAPFPSGLPKGLGKPFLRSCSLIDNIPPVETLYANHSEFEIRSDDCRTKRKRPAPNDMINVADADDHNQSFGFFLETSFQEKLPTSSPISSNITESHTMTDLDVLPSDFMKPRPCDRENFTEESDLSDSLWQIGKRGSNHLSLNSEQCSLSPDSLFGSVAWKEENFTDVHASKGNFMSRRSANSGNFRDGKEKYKFSSYENMQNSSFEGDHFASSSTNTDLDYEYHFTSKRGQPNDIFIQKVGSSNKLANGTDWSCLESSIIDNTNNCAVPTFHISPCYHKDGNPYDELDLHDSGRFLIPKGRSRRSHSAPPFYKGKGKFSTLLNCLTTTAGEKSDVPNLPVASESKHSSQYFGVSQHNFEPSQAKDFLFYSRKFMEKMPFGTDSTNRIHQSEDFKKSQCHHLYSTDEVEEAAKFSGTKRQNGDLQTTIEYVSDFQMDRDKSDNLYEQNDILDISSGLLHLAGGSVIPESISKDCLEDAKVLLQLDKKFIPVVAGVTLAVIDQHAADERIRLEELRQKVLSGEGKTIDYLDSEQELVLPEIGYQLLQNYAGQIQNWGWICNVHAQGSRSFTKNLNLLHGPISSVTLIAVPCILGVSLSDKDLLEFLEQLAETDGSSTMPPSVLRVLNFKACRGAIMFGDALLPSECALIVEELKQTSLCFQCAHGRPTTAPLVNLEALHKQIANLELLNGGSDELWHGLRQHRPSLERARQRLMSVRGRCG